MKDGWLHVELQNYLEEHQKAYTKIKISLKVGKCIKVQKGYFSAEVSSETKDLNIRYFRDNNYEQGSMLKKHWALLFVYIKK